MKLIAQGAESKIYLHKGNIIKERFKKSYRISQLDDRLRKARTKRESKVLEKLTKLNFPVPELISSNDEDKIKISYIQGKLLKDILNRKNYSPLSKEIGIKIALMHNEHIIHGDLTTSNMIIGDELYTIDFGLSFFSHKIEDKAVDLHLLREALESKHSKIWERCFREVLSGYGVNAKNGKEIIERLKIVEKRGRYKNKK
jgi:TP53 regulating kinase and related kinases